MPVVLDANVLVSAAISGVASAIPAMSAIIDDVVCLFFTSLISPLPNRFELVGLICSFRQRSFHLQDGFERRLIDV